MPTEPSLGNILIVDADDNISELLKINLGSEGYAVRRAVSYTHLTLPTT